MEWLNEQRLDTGSAGFEFFLSLYVSRVAITMYHRLGDLTEMYFLTVLDVRCLISRCQQGAFLWRVMGEGSVPGHLFCTWFVHGHLFLVSSYPVPSKFPFLIRTPVRCIRLHSNNFILI